MKVRILSAILMLVVFISLLIIGGEAFAISMALISVAGLYELLHIRESRKKFPFLMKVFAYLLVLFFSFDSYYPPFYFIVISSKCGRRWRLPYAFINAIISIYITIKNQTSFFEVTRSLGSDLPYVKNLFFTYGLNPTSKERKKLFWFLIIIHK